MTRRILFAVGSRANWSSVLPVLRACREYGHECRVVAFGSSLADTYGRPARNWDAECIEVPTLLDDDSRLGMAITAGVTGQNIAQVIAREGPDYVYVVGDRYEMLPVAYAAVLQNIRVAHQMGGELSGTIDESVRHAITKLSHVHLAATERSAERLRQMGEGNVHAVGCPRIDIAARVAPERGSFAMFAMHPVTTEDRAELERAAFGALLAAWPGHVHLFWPNADAGHTALVTEFKQQIGGRVMTHRNLPPEQYMALLAGAAVCVGNSSSAIREGAYLGTPVVDVGSRQRLREAAENVVRVRHADDLFPAIRHQLERGRYPRSTLYGDGRAAEKIATVLGGELPPVQKEWREWRFVS